MQVTFINNTPMRSGVFAAHLLALLARVDRRRHTVNFVTLRQEQPFEPVERLVNGELLFWRHATLGAVARVLRRSELVICRNYGAAFLALVIKKVVRGRYRVHADLRGGVPDEILAYGRFPINYLLFPPAKLMEWVIVRSSTSISCVSGPLREYLLERGAKPATTTVVPNGADMARCAFDPAVRAALRKELALEDNLVFVFSGSVRASGRPDRILRLFKAIHEADSRARLLILTPNTARFAALCKEIGVSALMLRKLDPEKVPSYLMAADYAFLLRREDAATRFSCPIKFAEYLAAGNRVIISRNVGDCSRFVEEHNAGVVIDDSERDEAVVTTLPEVPVHEKRRLAALAASDLNKDEIYGRYLAALGL